MGQIDCIARVMIAHMSELFAWNNPQINQILDETTAAEYALYLQFPDAEGERYRYLVEQVLMEDAAANDVLDMALALMFYPVFGAELKRETGSEATVRNGYLAENEINTDYQELQRTYELLRRIFISDSDRFPFFDDPFYVDNRLFGFLGGDDEPAFELRNCVSFYLYRTSGEEMEQMDWCRKQEMEELCECLKQLRAVWLLGNEWQEQTEILKKAAHDSQRNLIFLDVSKVEKEQMERVAELVIREAFFYQAYVCLIMKQENDDIKSQFFLREFEKKGLSICICAKENLELLYSAHTFFSRFYFHDIRSYDRIMIWEEMADKLGISLDVKGFARKFPLGRAKLRTIYYQLMECKKAGLPLTGENIANLCKGVAYMEVEKGELIAPNPEMSLDKLILSPEKKEILSKICNFEWYAQQVLKDWGMEKEYPYGKGAAALFTGPPGTGKTMAAYVISNMLDIPLYKVDLSQIADKYIGETEKHLEKVFDYAQKNHVILFFDEADAIFGKRSEVRDAKDRYANNEISYILQRIEQYEGIVLLTTNLKNNIDAAFMRRMKYIIHFAMPSEQERLCIWKKGFPKQLPAEDIDFAYLAAQFELSGGNIKNIILSAAFDAAGEQTAINMRHILSAVRNDFAKDNKIMTPEEFGEYEMLMREVR